MMLLRRVFPLFAATALLIQGAVGGQLDDFEEKASKKKEPKPKSESKPRSNSRRSTSSAFGSDPRFSSRGGDGFLQSFWFWMVGSPFAYRHYDPSSAMFSDAEEGEWSAGRRGPNYAHGTGSPVLPWLRVDYNRQYINASLEADDVRVEAGYRLLAFHGRHTRYTESRPKDHLEINQFYGVLRIGNTDMENFGILHGWEVGIGMGGVQQIGNTENSSFAVTLPIKIYPTETLGFEFRPAWYRPQERAIGDYDLSVSGGWRFVQLRAGYRWLWMQDVGHLFNGPYAGLSLSF